MNYDPKNRTATEQMAYEFWGLAETGNEDEDVPAIAGMIAAAEERGRRAGIEEAAKIAHGRGETLRKGSAQDRDLDTRMRAQAFEAQAIETHIRALAPRDSASVCDCALRIGDHHLATCATRKPRDSGKGTT